MHERVRSSLTIYPFHHSIDITYMNFSKPCAYHNFVYGEIVWYLGRYQVKGYLITEQNYNIIYKVIEKVIVLRLKPILSDVVIEDQFIFLQNRNIHNAASLAQEEIHTIKKEKQCAFALKLDLSKA